MKHVVFLPQLSWAFTFHQCTTLFLLMINSATGSTVSLLWYSLYLSLPRTLFSNVSHLLSCCVLLVFLCCYLLGFCSVVCFQRMSAGACLGRHIPQEKCFAQTLQFSVFLCFLFVLLLLLPLPWIWTHKTSHKETPRNTKNYTRHHKRVWIGWQNSIRPSAMFFPMLQYGYNTLFSVVPLVHFHPSTTSLL